MVPQELRLCLEPALSEEQSQETLNRYLPHIRSIIYNLLNGLKQKQAAYKRLMTERQQEFQVPSGPHMQTSGRLDPATDTKLSARSGTSTPSQGSGSSTPFSSQLPQTKFPSSQALAERQRAGGPSKPPPPDAFRPSRMRVPEANPPRGPGLPSPAPPDLPQLVRHQLVDKPVPTSTSTLNPTAPPPPPKHTPPHPDRFSRDSFGNPRPISRFSADSDLTNGSPIRSTTSHSSPKDVQISPETTNSRAQTVDSEPPSLPALNLPSALHLPITPLDKTALEEVPLSQVPPETRATLAALQRSDGLERRASKRFSSFTFNRMVPGSPNHKGASSGTSPQRPTRRADRAPPMPSLPESTASNNLAIASAFEARDRSPSLNDPTYLQAIGRESSRSSLDRPVSPASSLPGDSAGSIRLVKTPDSEDTNQQFTPRPGDISAASLSPGPVSGSMSIFLQIGRQVRKARLELPVTMSSLRLLFMERFEYDPGMENFPDVYTRDNRTGVQFELESMEDLSEGCVLSLDIERTCISSV